MRARSGFSQAELLDLEMGKDVLLVTPAGEAMGGGDRLFMLLLTLGFIMECRGPILGLRLDGTASTIGQRKTDQRRIQEPHTKRAPKEGSRKETSGRISDRHEDIGGLMYQPERSVRPISWHLCG